MCCLVEGPALHFPGALCLACAVTGQPAAGSEGRAAALISVGPAVAGEEPEDSTQDPLWLPGTQSL